MKSINAIIFLLIIFISLSSCKESDDKKESKIDDAVKKEQLATADLRKVSLNIEGMTCEIGCARTIQSKLSKTEGVKFAEVNFADKNGIVEYDASLISENQIVEVVEKIAGGDLYKVTETVSVK
jgi:Cu+-exporting ATPase